MVNIPEIGIAVTECNAVRPYLHIHHPLIFMCFLIALFLSRSLFGERQRQEEGKHRPDVPLWKSSFTRATQVSCRNFQNTGPRLGVC